MIQTDPNTQNYLVATLKPWNIEAFTQFTPELPGQWHLITEKNQLTTDYLNSLDPRYIFFPHWSWIVPEDILKHWECVCFHMADVPYGRGGSPLQNLIARGHKETRLSALQMVKELDAGPVYRKLPLSLEGSAQEIFERMAPKIYQLICYIVEQTPQPKPQEGEVTLFKRRTPEQSELPKTADLKALYDHIRMLDAQSYPKAYIDWGDYRMEFTDANQDDPDQLFASVFITKRPNKS
ncbi:methionyl-tRNA formyltransferase [Dongshaea marina]|uniref:methionyl-tRNA formyltransferase n=1 Tax=Dongshaea marina TaxID=2047966 RepID=UPI000D3E7A01|nr:methionyl-tRNA formyltransferase [Dongshaea marina]